VSEQTNPSSEQTLLVFNCHEPWVYQLGILGYKLDIIVGLKGRYTKSWDYQMRPLPANSRLISLEEAQQSNTNYYCIITHNIRDLLDVKRRAEPRLIVLHTTLEGRIAEEKTAIDPEKLKKMLHEYLRLMGIHAVATSICKGESWGLTEDIVHFGADPNDYQSFSGEIPSGIRICNFIDSRRKILLWDFHEKAFTDIPVKLVGHNPNMTNIIAAESWDHLKRLLQSHRFYIHTADLRFEAGYNMATVEAMAAGMPILGNCHPSSPVRHEISGFLSDDPQQLRLYAKILLEDRDLAILMGQQARKTAIEQFSLARFKDSFLKSIENTRRKWFARNGQLPVLQYNSQDKPAKQPKKSPQTLTAQQNI
jgi:hypothetical protein